MQRYRLTRCDELSGWFPPVRDFRPRLVIPVVERLPALGEPDTIWEQAAVAGPFIRPFETERTLASAKGLDVWSLDDDPRDMTPAQRNLRTTARLIAWRQCPRNYILRVLFECREPDMARIHGLAGRQDGDPLTCDHVSMLVNLDRTHERVMEIGINCAGTLFQRPYRQYVGAHSSEPTLAAGAPQVLGTTAPTRGRPVDQAPEDAKGTEWNAVGGRVWYTEDRWYAELQMSLNHFGEYADRFVVCPVNFVRYHPVAPIGSPVGIDWKAGVSCFTWSPIRFLVEEFEKAGFIAVGPVGKEAFERQVARLDADAMRARVNRRIDYVSRKKDAGDAWREQVDPKELDTQWRGKALPGFEFVDRGFTLNNSRQLITLEDGRTLVLAEDRTKLSLILAPAELDPVANDLSDVCVPLLGDGGVLRDGAAEDVSHASMIRDAAGVLHIVFSAGDNCWLAEHEQPDELALLRDASKWVVRKLPTDDGVKPYDLEVVGNGVAVVFADPEERMSALLLGTDAGPAELAFTGRCPVLARSSSTGVHLAYESNGTIYYVKLSDALSPIGEPEIAAYSVAFFPAMVEYDGAPLISYQYLGVQKAHADPEMYITERERSGCGIACAVADGDGGWRRQRVMKYEETAVRRLNSKQYMIDMVNRPHRGRVFLLPDENWRPCIGVDGSGVVRTAWQNTTRGHAFVAQWNGESFNRPEELAGPLPYPTPRVSLEKHAPRATQLKHLLVAERRVLLDAQPLCAVNLQRSEDVYFLDELIVQRRRGLVWRLNNPERHSSDPILKLAGAGRGGGRDGLGRPDVLPARDGGFVLVTNARGPGYEEDPHLFAHSDDGYKWEVIDEKAFLDALSDDLRELLTDAPSADDIVHAGYARTHVLRGFEDTHETDPAKRFKRLLVEGRVIDPHAVRRVWYSPDGVHWTKGPEARNDNHLNETHLPNVHDPWDKPERRFKIYGRTTSPQGRTLAMLWSPDMVDWHGDVAQVVYGDPYSRQAPPTSAPLRGGWVTLEGSASLGESEHYYCTAWLEAGLYMAIYANLNWDGHKSMRLAFSRDGFHFKRVGDCELLDVGTPGSFDSGSLDSPKVVTSGDRVMLYYSGTGEKHGSLPYTAQHCIGVATLGRKRWSYFEWASGREQGELLTVPVPMRDIVGRGLTVNVSGIQNGSDLRVEVIDASTGRTIEGFSADDCDPLADGFDVPVTWRGKALAQAKADTIQLRFAIRSRGGRLYSFALPTLEDR